MARRFVYCLFISAVSFAVQASDVQDLRAEFERLRAEFNKKSDDGKAPIDNVIASRYGPNATVTTKDGKLQVGGLLQVWFLAMQDDHKGIVQPAPGNNLAAPEPNGLNDRSTFRIRRTELRLSYDINQDISGYIMMDPTRETNLFFTPFPTFPQHNGIFVNPNLASGKGAQAGNTIIPQLLQDAYINYHPDGWHHDFTIGQYTPPEGEEANRNSGQLDFVDRAMCTAVGKVRDIGLQVHGSWWDGRFQYWTGVFNGAVGTILADPEILEGGNRTSTQNDKNFSLRITARPIWSADKWYGRLELGGHRTDGRNGSSGQAFDPSRAINGLNRQATWVNREGAWAWYRPGCAVRGWWFRGEWASYHDRFGADPRFRTNLLGTGSITDDSGNPVGQANPAPTTQSGWYFASGYRISDSRFADHFKNCDSWFRWMYDMEFTFRYEIFQNVIAESPSNPDRQTNLYKTQAYTAGINYYIKKWDARIQLNGSVVDDPEVKNLGIREIKNNLLVVSFQVMF
jgi:hypothetical protein